jgi:hypothetical protein
MTRPVARRARSRSPAQPKLGRLSALNGRPRIRPFSGDLTRRSPRLKIAAADLGKRSGTARPFQDHWAAPSIGGITQ